MASEPTCTAVRDGSARPQSPRAWWRYATAATSTTHSSTFKPASPRPSRCRTSGRTSSGGGSSAIGGRAEGWRRGGGGSAADGLEGRQLGSWAKPRHLDLRSFLRVDEFCRVHAPRADRHLFDLRQLAVRRNRAVVREPARAWEHPCFVRPDRFVISTHRAVEPATESRHQPRELDQTAVELAPQL